jgi:hypothetical protein
LHINKFACRKENPMGQTKYLYKVLSVIISRMNLKLYVTQRILPDNF